MLTGVSVYLIIQILHFGNLFIYKRQPYFVFFCKLCGSTICYANNRDKKRVITFNGWDDDWSTDSNKM